MVVLELVDPWRDFVMLKRALMFLFVTLVVGVGGAALAPEPVSAACEDPFLTFKPWYTGLTKNDADCTMKTPGVDEDNDGKPDSGDIIITVFVWAIILNILNILFGLVGYLALGFIIYGGFLYVLARGDTGRIAKGKRTVISAIVGLIICILASLISSTVVTIITEATGAA